MTTLNTQTFAQLVQGQVTAIQGAAAALLDLAIGSILRAIVESNAGVILWLQGLILQLLTVTRAATSQSADLDSFIADFNMQPPRFGATAATGYVTFSRFTATMQALVPVGQLLQTSDGTQQFIVTVDAGNPAYSASLNGYVVTAGTSGITVPVAAVVAGTGGNVRAGQISVIVQGIQYIDTVTNGLAFINGTAAESDTALRARFQAWVASLSKATMAAIGYAVTSLGLGLTYTLIENYSYAGAWQPGYFYVVVDDGTGAPPSSTITAVQNAVNAVRGFTIQFGVFSPVVISANISATITTATGYAHADVVAAVAAAVSAYISALPLGQSLPYTRLLQVIYDTSPGIINVTGVTINGATSDITATAQQVVMPGTVAIS